MNQTNNTQFTIIGFFASIVLFVLALSAGLAAPLIGAGAVAVLGSGSAAIFTGASGIAVITSIFGAAGAGLTGNWPIKTFLILLNFHITVIAILLQN